MTMCNGYDPDYHRSRILYDRRHFDGLLLKQLTELWAEVNKAATALDRRRPGDPQQAREGDALLDRCA